MVDDGVVTGFLGPDLRDVDVLRVAVVDDLELPRRRAVVALEADDRVEVVAVAPGLGAGLDRVAEARPAVVVVALALDDEPDPAVVGRVRDAVPGARVVVLATAEDDHLLGATLRAGAAGVVAREAPDGAVLDAVRAVAAGGAALTPVAAGALLDLVAAGGVAVEGVRRPLSLLASGVDLASAADDVGRSPAELSGLLAEALASVAT